MVLEVSYGLGCAAFLILTTLTLINRRPEGMGLFAVCVFAMTAIWSLLAAVQTEWMPGFAHVVEIIRSWMWLQFMASVLTLANRRAGNPAHLFYRAVIPTLGVLALINDLQYLHTTVSPVDFTILQMFERVLIAIVGLLLVENLLRNTRASRRWHIFPLCLAAGSLFAYDLFVFAEALIMRGADLTLLAVRGLVLVLIVPLLVLTMARNTDWRIDIHVSRRVVFHTATLTAGGTFLLAAAGAASLLGEIPGEWGALLKVVFFCGSVLVLGAVVSTEGLKSRVRRLISENFFSRRYDYREEWLRFVDTLSTSDDVDSLQTRVIRAVGNIVDSPGGALWLERDGAYHQVEKWGLNLIGAEAEPCDSDFVAAFEGGKMVLDLSVLAQAGKPLPQWAQSGPPVWLAVPLVLMNEIVGFIVLMPPRAPLMLSWESFELLRTVGRQAASYLMEEQATRALVDAQAIIEYNKKFAFIVHDVKNLSSQLGMMVSNIRRYSDRPEFRADMIRTLENSVGRLNGLLNKLRSDGGTVRPREIIDPVPVIEAVIRDLARGNVGIEADLPEGCVVRVRMDVQELSSVLTHLLTNAVEASPAGETVRVRLKPQETRFVLDIEDSGPGMDPAFVRNELFTPLKSTKSRGHGIGAFQARDVIRGAGGELEVITAPGRGTIMRILLPNAAPTAERPVAALSQRASGA